LRDTGYLRDPAPATSSTAQRWRSREAARKSGVVVDTVGSHTLANVCASTHSSGIVTACGLAQGMDLPATVAPFILRGVTLAGINSVMASMEKRVAAWAMLERLIDHDKLKSLSREIGLSDVIGVTPRFLAGEITGRLVVNVAR
jgi:acrylyl-CoA reductase (NADPH)